MTAFTMKKRHRKEKATTAAERKKLRIAKKLRKELLSERLIAETKDVESTDCLIVIRDNEIYFLSPFDEIPFYYNYYKNLKN